MYTHLDYAKNIHPQRSFDIEETVLIQALHHSRGQRTMSDEDVKLAILSLFNTCKTQQEFIDELVECVNDLRTPKKKFWYRRK